MAVDPRELEPGTPTIRIPAVDRMFGDRIEVESLDMIVAYNNITPRVRALCTISDSEAGQYAHLSSGQVDAYSEPKDYKLLDTGDLVRLRMCMLKKPASALVDETETYDAPGLLLEIVTTNGDVQVFEPLLELTEYHIWANPMIIGFENNSQRTNDPDDLRSFFKALYWFDGQGEPPVEPQSF